SDVGFGSNTPSFPFKLALNEEQGNSHTSLRVKKWEEDYKLETQVAGNWKDLHRFSLDKIYYSDFELANFFIYAHPGSKFRNHLMISKIIPEGRITLNDLQFSF